MLLLRLSCSALVEPFRIAFSMTIDLSLRSFEFWFAPSITSCRPCRDAIAVRFVPPSVAGARADEVEIGSWREGAVSRDLGFGLWESEAGEGVAAEQEVRVFAPFGLGGVVRAVATMRRGTG